MQKGAPDCIFNPGLLLMYNDIAAYSAEDVSDVEAGTAFAAARDVSVAVSFEVGEFSGDTTAASAAGASVSDMVGTKAFCSGTTGMPAGASGICPDKA